MDDLQKNAKHLASISLGIGAIKLRPDKPFQWASGYMMPIYNDNRMLLGKSMHRKHIVESFRKIISYYSLPGSIIAGTSTAGIPHATSLADKLNLPLVYVRDKSKEHGMKNRIEGIDAEKDLAGRQVILIEDLISTGGSSASAVDAIRKANGRINYCLSIFDYGLDEAKNIFSGQKSFDKEGHKLNPSCEVFSILDYDTLLSVAQVQGYIGQSQLKMLEEWRADPFNWGAKHGFPKVEKKT